MSTFIECNNCGEVKDVEAKSVTLPYFCGECVAADQFQKDITPKAGEVAIKRLDEYPTLTELVTKEELRSSYMDDDNATVENTTLLIQDLEAQILDQKELNNKANELLTDMSNQLAEDAAELGERDRRIAADSELLADISTQKCEAVALNERLQQDMSTLIDKLNHERDEVTRLRNLATTMGIKGFTENQHFVRFFGRMFDLAGEWDAERADLVQQLEVAGNKLSVEKMVSENSTRIARMTSEALAQANEELKQITADRDYLRKRRDHWRSAATELNRDNRQLLKRGLIARIRNA
jgi:hypothetical protein